MLAPLKNRALLERDGHTEQLLRAIGRTVHAGVDRRARQAEAGAGRRRGDVITP